MGCSGELRWSQRSELGLIFAWGGCRAELAFKAGFCMWLKGKEKRGENIFQRFVNVFGGPTRWLVCVVFSVIGSGRLAAIVAEMVIECAGDNYLQAVAASQAGGGAGGRV